MQQLFAFHHFFIQRGYIVVTMKCLSKKHIVFTAFILIYIHIILGERVSALGRRIQVTRNSTFSCPEQVSPSRTSFSERAFERLAVPRDFVKRLNVPSEIQRTNLWKRKVIFRVFERLSERFVRPYRVTRKVFRSLFEPVVDFSLSHRAIVRAFSSNRARTLSRGSDRFTRKFYLKCLRKYSIRIYNIHTNIYIHTYIYIYIYLLLASSIFLKFLIHPPPILTNLANIIINIKGIIIKSPL